MSKPDWIMEAEKLIGLHESPGSIDNPIVVGLFKDAGHSEVIHDETPWCAAFVGAVLNRSNHKGNGSLWALDYAKWGQALDDVALGAVATKKRIDNKTGKLVGGHVFFVVGWDDKHVYGLGGNQRDQVSITEFNRSDIVAYRWPSDVPLPDQQPKFLAVTDFAAAGSEA
ncbi:Conserved hypothetical protein CHP02594 [Nitrosomonas sp. Is79A3]|uniref:TIGR02594 family protein n=1 Tax=Nitrosomonas sp. (strain Is79A3) TaxID=261292 RepID=UPI000215CA42